MLEAWACAEPARRNTIAADRHFAAVMRSESGAVLVRADAVHPSPNARSSEPARILISPVEVVSRLIELVFSVLCCVSGLCEKRCNFI
jgi:hypothetical protein